MKDKSLEGALLEHLKYSNVDQEKLSEAVRTIVSVANSTGTKPVRAFPKGIPFPDGFGWLTLITQKEKLFEYIKKVVSDYPTIDLEHFPLGIPYPDAWLVINKFGAGSPH